MYSEKDIPIVTAEKCWVAMDGCNLSGITHGFAEACKELWHHAHKLQDEGNAVYGTEWVNQHPIVTMYLDKLCQLNTSIIVDKAGMSIQDCYHLVRTAIDKSKVPAV